MTIRGAVSIDTGGRLYDWSAQLYTATADLILEELLTSGAADETDILQLYRSQIGYDHSALVRSRTINTANATNTTGATAVRSIEKPPVNTNHPSPNHGSRRGTDIDTIVLHHTGTNNLRSDLNTLTSPNSGVSAHYLIAKDGTIYQLVNDERRAWHAGESALHGVPTDVNARSIGIEIVSDGSRGSYTEAQYRALERLVPYLAQRYDVPLRNIVGHKDVAIPRGRKNDPANFDFDRIRRAVRENPGGPTTPPRTPPNPPPTSPNPPTRPDVTAPASNLRRGNRGAEVRQLQAALVKLGYMTQAQVNTGPGIFGPRTEAAVRNFQRDHNLVADGIYGPRTRAALRRALNDTRPAAPAVNLRRGNRGAEVRQLQAALVELDYMTQAQVNTGPGIFGPRTEAALRRFQRDHNLAADGIYGPGTRAALREALNDRRPRRPERPTPSPDRPTPNPGPVSPNNLANVPGSENVSRAFKEKVIQIARRLDMDPNFLMAVMSFESRLNPRAVNSLSGATGLIQFLPSTARRLGTTTAELRNMSAERQLDFVERYLRPYAGRMDTIEDAYMAVFYPRALGRENSYVLFRRGSREYAQNSGLDHNRDGTVTKGEAARRVREILERAR